MSRDATSGREPIRRGTGLASALFAAAAVAVALALANALLALRGQLWIEQGLLRLALFDLASGTLAALPRWLAVTCSVALGLALLRVALADRLRGPPRLARIARPWRVTCGLLVALAGVLVAGAAAVSALMPPPGPNVVLVIVDTLRADHLGVYGHGADTSPQIDGFASRATVFEQARSSAPWTRPAVASILASRDPLELGLLREGVTGRLPEAIPTLAEVLRNRGYRTAAFVTNPHYRFGLLQGFEHVDFESDAPAEAVYDDVLAWLAGHRSKPFFLLVHNNDPHDQYRHREGFSTTPRSSRLRGPAGLLPAWQDGSAFSYDSEENRAGTVVLGASDLSEMKANYDGEIRYLDRHFGRLLTALEDLALDENTIVALTSDHGEEFLDHGSYWHGGTLYDELLHVPLLLRVPGRPADRISARVGTIDLYPTLLDLLGIAPPRGATLAGRSLVPLLDGAPWTDVPQLAVTGFRGALKLAVVHDQHKLIRFADGPLIGLFDLTRDPGEHEDRSELDPARLRELDGVLTELARSAPANAADAAPAPEVDDETLDQLRALGYLSGPSSLGKD